MMLSHRILLGALCAAAGAAAAAAPYELSLNAERRGDSVSIAPTVVAAPGKRLRYEIEARKDGASSSRSQQAGEVTIGAEGRAVLSHMSFSAGPRERCEISVRVFEAGRLVASQSTGCTP
ncbi:MAG TPA: curli-like amyloid fiber formation chaperone CsgH [Burkholderiales bacterium]|nr:curli-like amyloid fiber formation chaperone CsgH [Burkholderiales bacterium]